MARNTLPPTLRRALEKTIKAARVVAETAATEAIARLGVADPAAPGFLRPEDQELRRKLRAHGRTLGDSRAATGAQTVSRLIEAVAYEHWHRMLFARFLAERGLLRHPELDAALTLAECAELAEAEGSDGWTLAGRYAALLLPAIFQPDHPTLAVQLAPNHSVALVEMVTTLDPAVFASDDALGWTYQFWRAAEKDAVNKAGKKIDAASLPAVTQLFTEPYMVRFLLHNTLGAWWAGKLLAANPALALTAADEAELRAACAVGGEDWDFLRFVREGAGGDAAEVGAWRPAAGAYPGWPGTAAAITFLDPCCGSGHFLTEALILLSALRAAEEGLDRPAAVAAVLRDNLHGLEIDGRCVQIASFAVALTAASLGARLGEAGSLPNPHIAWVGAPPPLPKAEFAALANGDAELRRGLETLHDLFAQAPLLGSLIAPVASVGGDLLEPVRMARIETSIDALVARMRGAEPERVEGVVAARGMADAASILSRRFVLQATNVPFLGRGRQAPELAAHLAARFDNAKADLATAMLQRMRALAAPGATLAAVTPQNWLFLGSYKKLRETLLTHVSLTLMAVLGEHGFDSSAAAGAFTALVALTETRPDAKTAFAGLDANNALDPSGKAAVLVGGEVRLLAQAGQRNNPDARIVLGNGISEELLKNFSDSRYGLRTGDGARLINFFWEQRLEEGRWRFHQGVPDKSGYYRGRESVLLWDNGNGALKDLADQGVASLQGIDAWGKLGIFVGLMRSLPVTLYTGETYDNNGAAIWVEEEELLSAIWCFCNDTRYAEFVRNIDQSLKVPNQTLLKVPFDVKYWRSVAASKYPDGLPKPSSDDPTQWVFHGHPAVAECGARLHAAMARLAGYSWPAETDTMMRLAPDARALIARCADLPEPDADGILCLPALGADAALADRLRAMLAAAFGTDWSDATERRLIAEAGGTEAMSLEAWLRTRFFRGHCTLFHQRPFLWQITDGLSDGFSAILHYHRLTRAALEKLTYAVLNDWIARMQAANRDVHAERARLLQAKLVLILEGDCPYDIFVRWKPLARQPLGWDPDLDDGVRMNIRPFMQAGILAWQPNIKWTKDRGADVPSAPWYPVHKGERINDHHTTLAEKRAARAKAKLS
jgi:hypothetical protein